MLDIYGAIEVNGKLEYRLSEIGRHKVILLEKLLEIYQEPYEQTKLQEVTDSILTLAKVIAKELHVENYELTSIFTEDTNILFILNIFVYLNSYGINRDNLNSLKQIIKNAYRKKRKKLI
ncbi:hypothetical protein [Bacillus thuringiensis]|uniref:hypothetical protein n=1 Tax=Bacillus thuringiensis TaxID=1428 RepID=UPI001C9307DF|nr:hypothetical protein [Bacillus thuringiensis]